MLMSKYYFRYYIGDVFYCNVFSAVSEAQAIQIFLCSLDCPDDMHGLCIAKFN